MLTKDQVEKLLSKEILGMSLAQAKKVVEKIICHSGKTKTNMTLRVVKIDDNSLPITMDYNLCRLNVEVKGQPKYITGKIYVG